MMYLIISLVIGSLRFGIDSHLFTSLSMSLMYFDCLPKISRQGLAMLALIDKSEAALKYLDIVPDLIALHNNVVLNVF